MAPTGVDDPVADDPGAPPLGVGEFGLDGVPDGVGASAKSLSTSGLDHTTDFNPPCAYHSRTIAGDSYASTPPNPPVDSFPTLPLPMSNVTTPGSASCVSPVTLVSVCTLATPPTQNPTPSLCVQAPSTARTLRAMATTSGGGASCAHAPPPRPSAVNFQMSEDGGGTANHEVMPPQT